LKNSNGICTLQKPQQWRGLQRNLTDELDVPLRMGIDGSVFERHELVVRNRREPIVIRTIEDVERLIRNLNK
jgi:hypothetical protein